MSYDRGFSGWSRYYFDQIGWTIRERTDAEGVVTKPNRVGPCEVLVGGLTPIEFATRPRDATITRTDSAYERGQLGEQVSGLIHFMPTTPTRYL